mmetsp:Transcript_122009/g.379811  ORF Transcript_122009/g.379811 Transcript_122009/m.379811 type:complete len:186 (+) Transcript_122009:101-658(+)
MARLFPSLLLLGVAATALRGLAFLAAGGSLHRGRPECRRVGVAMRGKIAKEGIFSPIVEGAKAALGLEKLNELRGEVIKAHSGVIAQFVDTSESPFGKIALRRLFEAADTDGSGKLDKEEVKACLRALGFEWVDDKKADQLISKGDLDDDEEIDFEEFVKTAPRVLRQNLIKLAKQNGNDLGFLS